MTATKPKPASAKQVTFDHVTDYARKVLAGEIIAGRLVRLACARHVKDVEGGASRGLKWDVAAANRAIGFAKFLRLPEGDKAFELQPAQKFIVGSLFGWKGPDGYRRFRYAYVEMGKGNGKSPLAGLIGLYGLVADGEPSPEVYAAATTRDQASIMFRDAKRMAENSRDLSGRLEIHEHNIANFKNGGWFRPLSSEHRGLDGKRVHFGLIDEVHEHPNSMVCDKVRAGTKGRRQALIFEITNSGHDRQTVCWQHHEYSRKIVEGMLADDAWFGYVCGLDPCEAHVKEGRTMPVDGCAACDDWRDEKVWRKANPLLDVSVTMKYLREQVHTAIGMPTAEGIVKRLNFCIWTETQSAWISSDLWARGVSPVDFSSLVREGWACFGGLDLSNRFDLTAFVLLFRGPTVASEDPTKPAVAVHKLVPFFWIPEAIADKKEKADRVPYRLWQSQGFLRFTAGDVTDYGEIERFIRDEIVTKTPIRGIGYDPYQATQMAINLQNFGVQVQDFTQNTRNFHEPCETFERLLAEGKLHHGGHPVLTWNAGNVEIKLDLENRKRPVKPDQYSPKKIDGIVAALMALGVSFLHPEDGGATDEDIFGWM